MIFSRFEELGFFIWHRLIPPPLILLFRHKKAPPFGVLKKQVFRSRTEIFLYQGVLCR
jgi:hypothetical protein